MTVAYHNTCKRYPFFFILSSILLKNSGALQAALEFLLFSFPESPFFSDLSGDVHRPGWGRSAGWLFPDIIALHLPFHFAPQGDFLMGRKSPKTHQREIPLETPCFYLVLPGRGPSRPWAWRGGLDGLAHLWAVSTPLIASTPSTRASNLVGSGLARPLSAGMHHR